MLRLGQTLAKPLDMHVDRTLVSLVIEAPDLLDQRVAAERLARVAGEQEEQLEFLERKGGFLAADPALERLAVQLELPDPDLLGSRNPVALQQRLHPRGQLEGIERLDEVIVRAELESLDLMHRFSLGRKHEDRHPLVVLSQPAAQLPPVHLRHHDIEHDEIGSPGRQLEESLAAVGRFFRRITFLAEQMGDQLADMAVVVDDKDVSHVGSAFPIALIGILSVSFSLRKPDGAASAAGLILTVLYELNMYTAACANKKKQTPAAIGDLSLSNERRSAFARARDKKPVMQARKAMHAPVQQPAASAAVSGISAASRHGLRSSRRTAR
ncbi:hypothetical protein BN871_FJ_00030 [Paenibacillus sp. P22]|nr:hypothetical protein BN871_FJ_00030 [Paenibacillus sp. P22]